MAQTLKTPFLLPNRKTRLDVRSTVPILIKMKRDEILVKSVMFE